MLRPIPLSILVGLAASCASTAPLRVQESAPPLEHSAAAIAHRLADAAVVRADPNHMRLLVHFRRPDDPGLEVVAPELERELVTALSGRFHLFDSGLAADAEASQADLDALVERLGVTHALICDTARKNGEIVLSLRLVEHESLLIVATAQGSFPVDVLADVNRVALTRAEEPQMAAVVAVPPPIEPSSSVTSVLEPVDVAQLDSPLVAANLADARGDGDTTPFVRIPARERAPEAAPSSVEQPTVEPISSRRETQPEAESDVPKGPAYWRLKAVGRNLGRR